MNSETKDTLNRVATDVLERFTFMFTDPPEEPVDVWNGEYLHAIITFKGPTQGAISITAPEPLCKEIGANVLGMMDPDEVSQETGEDALKELLNIICGELVAELYGTKVIIELTVPSLVRIDKSKWRELTADDNNITLLVEEQPLLVSLLVAE